MTSTTDTPLAFATGQVMSAADALMWRADDDRRFRAQVCGIEVLDRAPDWDRLVEAIDWATRMIPRLRQRAIDSPLRVGVPTWTVDSAFDLRYHLRRARVPGNGMWSDLLGAAEVFAMTPLDRARTPWEAVLFEGLPDGGAAFVVKVHHALTDGKSAVLGMSLLRSTVREPQPDKPQPAPPSPEHPDPIEVLGNQVVDSARTVPGVLGGVAQAFSALRDPRQALSATLDYARSAPRVAGAAGPPGSPLLAGRSLAWRFSTFDMHYADLRAAAKFAGASVNDAYLAGLSGAMRHYHDRLGAPVVAIPLALPISIRAEGDTTAGNKITVGRVAAPLALDDPLECMLTIREQVRRARREPAAGMFDVVGPILVWLPSEVLGFAGKTASVNDVQASNVPGPRHDTYMAGAKIERSYPFGPLPGCAVMATMFTQGDIACLGINHDDAAVADRALFAECVVEGFAEVLALAPGAHRPIHRG